MPLTTVNPSLLDTQAQYTGFKNRLINGGMQISQRNAGASVTPVNQQYTLDRWVTVLTQSSKFTIQQDAGAVTPPTGFTDYLGATVGASANVTLGAADAFLIAQYIEGFNVSDLGWGTANAQTVTLSFWVRSSRTGTFGGALVNSANNRSYPFTYVINSANTWEYKTVTIPGDTSGTWLTTNGVGIRLRFGLGSGSNFLGTAGAWASADIVQPSGTVAPITTNGATWYITGVQLEKGSTATSFDYRPYGTELSLCQRYYWQRNGESTFAAIGSGLMVTINLARVFFNYPMPMRAAPTISVTNIGNTIFSQGGSDLIPSAINPYANSTGAMADLTVSGGNVGAGTVWFFNSASSASVQATAEL